jgi:hypothetical protein
MHDEPLVTELQQVLTACEKLHLPVFVIGAFSVRAYDCLFRASYDLDLAVTSEYWPKLKQLLESLGYSVAPDQVWITAVKSLGESQIEINVALNAVTDLNSGIAYPLTHHHPERHQPADLDFGLPVLPLEAVLITKLIALRDQDVADVLGVLLERGDDIQAERFWQFVRAARIARPVRERLHRVIDYLSSGEALSVWYDRTGALLTDTERDAALVIVQRLLKSQSPR